MKSFTFAINGKVSPTFLWNWIRNGQWKKLILRFITCFAVSLSSMPGKQLDGAFGKVLPVMTNTGEAEHDVVFGSLRCNLVDWVPERFPPSLFEVMPEH
jgi:hypothetical protein